MVISLDKCPTYIKKRVRKLPHVFLAFSVPPYYTVLEAKLIHHYKMFLNQLGYYVTPANGRIVDVTGLASKNFQRDSKISLLQI